MGKSNKKSRRFFTGGLLEMRCEVRGALSGGFAAAQKERRPAQGEQGEGGGKRTTQGGVPPYPEVAQGDGGGRATVILIGLPRGGICAGCCVSYAGSGGIDQGTVG